MGLRGKGRSSVRVRHHTNALEETAKDIPGLKTVCDASERDDIGRPVAASVEALAGLHVRVSDVCIAEPTARVATLDPDR